MFGNHWLNINAERMERYETMFRWNPATEHFYAAAMIGEGHQIADFGCGPGHAAIEFAKWVGPRGHVHALDINEEFVLRARIRADQQAIGTRITTHRRGSEEAVFGLQMPRRNRRPVMAGFRFERGSVGRRPTSPGQVWRG